MAKPMSLRSERKYAPCDEDWPHDMSCPHCHKASVDIHLAAENVRAFIENAADVVMIAIKESDPLTRVELLNAVTIILEAANSRVGIEISIARSPAKGASAPVP